MKICPNCGRKVRDDEKICPECGHHFEESALYRKSADDPPSENNLKLKKIVPWAIGIFILILVIILFFLLRNFNSPEAQTNILVNAINNNDDQKVATLLSTKEKQVDADEAEVYIKYIKDEIGMKQFTNSIENTVQKLNKNKSSVASYIQTKSGQDILRVSKNGTRYIFFDNMSFTAPTKQPIVKPKVQTKYEFKSNGKKKTIVAEANKNTPLGNFIPGVYKIPATKTTKNGEFYGTLDFDFRESNSETVDVNENFEEANVSVKLKGDTKLDDSSKKVTINDRTMDFSSSKSYGPYPKNKDINISASGKAKGKTFTTTTKIIKADDLKDNTEVTLEFDDEDIDDYVAKKEREENSLKNKLSQFFTGYSSAIDSAFGQSNFNFLSTYIKKDSSYYKDMEQDVKDHKYTRMQSPQVLSAEQDGDKVTTKVQYLDNTGQLVNDDYELETNKQDRLQLVKLNDK